jgi:hypothetical protein
MRCLTLAAALVLTFTGCGSTAVVGDGGGGQGGTTDAPSIRAQEGHACSTSPDDDPQLVCTTGMDLVCISTYSRTVTNPEEARKFDGGIRQVFVCRMPCSADSDCPQPGDICCPGPIHGKTFGKMAACVPPGSCETQPRAADGGP